MFQGWTAFQAVQREGGLGNQECRALFSAWRLPRGKSHKFSQEPVGPCELGQLQRTVGRNSCLCTQEILKTQWLPSVLLLKSGQLPWGVCGREVTSGGERTLSRGGGSGQGRQGVYVCVCLCA